MSMGPELRVALRFFYVVHSEEGNPWAGELRRWPGLDPYETLPTPEDIILGHFAAAKEVWARYGVILELHRDGVSAVAGDKFYDMNVDDDPLDKAELADLMWSRGQTCIDIYYVRKLRNKDNKQVFGETQLPTSLHDDGRLNHRGVSTIMSGNPTPKGKPFWDHPLAWTLAHELGHAFGLAHPFISEYFADPAAVEAIAFWPFEDETLHPSTFNLMSYPFALASDPTEDEMLEKAFLKPNQVRRVHLTLHGREANFFWVEDAINASETVGAIAEETWESVLAAPADSIPALRRQYYAERPYPDLIGAFHAAWLG